MHDSTRWPGSRPGLERRRFALESAILLPTPMPLTLPPSNARPRWPRLLLTAIVLAALAALVILEAN
ncbi:MAG TPA: hypothetical protein VE998_02875, partial [Terriglobales bacterium]|nr:hypothetical protein [Terriglobales bacterium]